MHCYNCRQPGHIARYCPRNRDDRRERDDRHVGRRAGSHMIKKNPLTEIQNNVDSKNMSHVNSSSTTSPDNCDRSLTVHCWNANSIRNKSTTLVEHIIDYDVDIMFLVETKVKAEETVVLGECTPPGYKFLSFPRCERLGGGIGIVYKEPLDLTASSTFSTINFEHCIATLKNSIQFAVIYRPPPSTENGLKTSEFLEDFEVFLEELSIIPDNVVLLGDYNIHVDEPDKSETRKFNDILASNGFCQLISGPTHKKGHTLDLLLTNENDHIIQRHEVLPQYYSDHRFITCSLNHMKPPPAKVVISSRQFGKMKPEHFTDLLSKRLSDFPFDSEDPDVLTDAYESITLSVLNEVCPITTRERTIRSRLPWYNEDIHLERRIKRRLERKWRKSQSDEDHEVFVAQKNKIIKLITDSKIEYFSNKFSESNTKDMYATINDLLNKTQKVLPTLDCSHQALANEFLSFFIEKVDKIRNNVKPGTRVDEEVKMIEVNVNNCCMDTFAPLTESDVEKIIKRFPSKSCHLDTLPTWLVKDNLVILLPIFTRIVNCSLMSGIFPNALKQSIITPVIKKPNLDNNMLKNYRPVANMKFVSKVIEKAASCQVTTHVDDNNLGEIHQSSYKRFHSTESALLKVKNDILQSTWTMVRSFS